MSYLREKELTVLLILVIKALNPLERNTSIFMFMHESILSVVTVQLAPSQVGKGWVRI